MSVLVSIIVATYNSEKYIIEMLESARKQTYENLELIIADDCSTDNTIKLCTNWCEKHKNRFIRTSITKTKRNSGISVNLNNGIRYANGEWIKPIAGDDVLVEECIEKNVMHRSLGNIILSYVESFNERGVREILPRPETLGFFNLPAQKQFEKLFLRNFLPAPALFINAAYLRSIKCYDESYPHVEDYPLWLTATYSGEQIKFFNFVSVRYRLHQSSLSHVGNEEYNEKMHSFDKLLIKNFSRSNVVRVSLRIDRFFESFIRDRVIENGNNKRAFTWYNRYRYLNPCNYIRYIRNFIKTYIIINIKNR